MTLRLSATEKLFNIVLSEEKQKYLFKSFYDSTDIILLTYMKASCHNYFLKITSFIYIPVPKDLKMLNKNDVKKAFTKLDVLT